MERILITGASGFVGTEVLRQLVRRKIAVTAVGRHDPRAGTVCAKACGTGVSAEELDEYVDFIKADITDKENIEAAFAHSKGKLPPAGHDAVIHLASLPGDTGNPEEMVRVNVNGCVNILEFARGAKINRFVSASSISAYEWYPATQFHPPDYMPVDEEHPCRPRDMYSSSKRMQELLMLTYAGQFAMETCALRLTAVIGPAGKGGGRGWLEIARQMSEGKSVKIPHFSAEELCHYVDIRDAAAMCITAAEHPGAKGEIFNCCGPAPVRGHEFAAAMKKTVPQINVEYGFPWSMAQGGELCFSMEKAERRLDFRPRFSVADSLEAIKNWIDAGGISDTAEMNRYTQGVEKKND